MFVKLEKTDIFYLYVEKGKQNPKESLNHLYEL
jgi:hypothetical protein